MNSIPSFDSSILRAICNVLGDTSNGLTGSEIEQILKDCDINDPLPGMTKRDRLFSALNEKQKQDRCANNIVAFIMKAMNPVRYTTDPQKFEILRIGLNNTLPFAGYSLGENGKLQVKDKVNTLSQARERAGKLNNELSARKAHHDILRFCKAELLQDNYFHAVLEATKSIAEKIRLKSNLSYDGNILVQKAFGGDEPLLVFNTMETESEKNEHRGYMNLLKGLFSAFRNPTAHEPKIKWNINEQDALEILTFMSLLHRKLDSCVLTRRRQ